MLPKVCDVSYGQAGLRKSAQPIIPPDLPRQAAPGR